MPPLSRTALRKIASNLLLDSEGLHRNPLIELSDAGELCAVTYTAHPDREPFTEFFAGVVVVGLEGFDPARLHDDLSTPLPELLRPYLRVGSRRVVLFTGLDYTHLRLTQASRLRRL